MTLLEKIEFLIEDNGLNNRQLSINADIPYGTIRNFWIQGVSKMQLPTFRKLCDYFNVTMDSMAYDELEIRYKTDKSPAALTREECELLNKYYKLDERGQTSVQDTLDRELYYTHEEKREISFAS